MSCSKPVPQFMFDTLYYLNRDQLERVTIVCRSLKNLINRYFHSKPYRVFNELYIRGGSYALAHDNARWHPNRDDYNVQQFLADHKCSIDESKGIFDDFVFYSFADMHPYLGPTVRIDCNIVIYVAVESIYNPEHIEEMESASAGGSIYNPEHVAEMESIAYLWRDCRIEILPADKEDEDSRIVAEDFKLILNSPTILQCRKLCIRSADFSFKDYKVLYTANVIEIFYRAEEEIDPSNWMEFLAQPGKKPIVALQYFFKGDIDNALECFKKAFSSAIVPNSCKIVFESEESLTEFRETNKTSGEILELKKGFPTDYDSDDVDFVDDWCYTLERSSI